MRYDLLETSPGWKKIIVDIARAFVSNKATLMNPRNEHERKFTLEFINQYGPTMMKLTQTKEVKKILNQFASIERKLKSFDTEYHQ